MIIKGILKNSSGRRGPISQKDAMADYLETLEGQIPWGFQGGGAPLAECLRLGGSRVGGAPLGKVIRKIVKITFYFFALLGDSKLFFGDSLKHYERDS